MKTFWVSGVVVSLFVIACGGESPSEESQDLSSTGAGGSITAPCTPQECGPEPLFVEKCPGGGIAGPVCQRNAEDQCRWVIEHCPGVTAPPTVSTVICEPPSMPPHAGCKWDVKACDWLCI